MEEVVVTIKENKNQERKNNTEKKQYLILDGQIILEIEFITSEEIKVTSFHFIGQENPMR